MTPARTVPAPQQCSGCRDGKAFPLPFAIAYQPIVDVERGTVFAYEALVRGAGGEAATTILDRVMDENRYGFDQAIRARAIEAAVAAGLLDSGAKLSINFLPNAVYSPVACIQLTLRTAAACGLPLDRLIFEFTEGEHMSSPAHVESIIDAYRRMGFAVAIDDFGAGFAGLDLFARFNVDLIKIDMDLVRGLDADRRRRAIVGGIVAMCRPLGTLVVAEGIETREEADALRSLGVTLQQGYYYARPGLGMLPVVAG